MLRNQDGIPFAWYSQTAADVAKKVDEIYEDVRYVRVGTCIDSPFW